jgi:hypothetical protein
MLEKGGEDFPESCQICWESPFLRTTTPSMELGVAFGSISGIWTEACPITGWPIWTSPGRGKNSKEVEGSKPPPSARVSVWP